MQRYSWPGNVRELENCIERAVVLCRNAYVEPDDLPPIVVKGASAAPQEAPPSGDHLPLKQAMKSPEKQLIASALRSNGGNRQATAAQLGINRTTLYKKMKRYGLMDEA
jgi:DNA-binding NtrC family response regulator